jgi:hypothetical protein
MISNNNNGDDEKMDIRNENSDGEILELEEQFSELCALYDNLFPNGKKTITTTTTTAIATTLQVNETNPIERESSLSSFNLSDEISFFESPSKLTTRSLPPFSKRIDLLSDSEEENIPFGSNHHLIEAALETLPSLSIPDTCTQVPYISQFSIPSIKKPQDINHLRRNENFKTVISDSNQPWVIIRGYEKRGGKKIRLPASIEDLIQLSGDKLGIIPVCIREVSTEAEIEDISAIESNSVLWVMTEEDERNFCNPQLL